MLLSFTKCHANGNDFIFIHSKNFSAKYRNKKIIKRLCDRQIGIGADGLFIVYPSNIYDFSLDYYNADGSWETLCANGSRCAVLLMNKLENKNKHVVFKAGDGVHCAQILKNGTVSMQMLEPKYCSDKLHVSGFSGYFINSGARHFVVEAQTLDDNFILEAAKKIRYSSKFSPKGINVNFYTIVNRGLVNIKTYEKGVEKVMHSCASGSTAVIFHLAKNKLIDSPVITASSGGKLKICFSNKINEFSVIGPSEILYDGQFNFNLLL